MFARAGRSPWGVSRSAGKRDLLVNGRLAVDDRDMLLAQLVYHVVVDSTPSGVSPWVTSLISVLLGVLIGSFAEIIKERIRRPKLTLKFMPDEHCLRVSPAKSAAGDRLGVIEANMSVLRMRVENNTTPLAKGCRAFLYQIDVVIPGMTKTARTIFADRIPLKWAYLDEEPKDIPRGTWIYCDLVSTLNVDHRLVLHSSVSPYIVTEELKNQALYRFCCCVAGENFKPVTISLLVDWKEHFFNADNVKVEN